MNTLLYSLQCLIVLGVPPLFGWVLLRRIFREANWLALAPGAVVAGLVALMALVNELRFFWEMRVAVWTAYKLLLAFTLALVFTKLPQAPRLRLPGCVSRPWKLLLVMAGACGAGCYYDIPAFKGYLNDAWWYHYPAAVQIQNVELFPLRHVFALDDIHYYHQGPDILAACWSFLLELPVQTAWALNIVILAPCAFLLAFALIARLSRNYWSAILAATLLVGGGNLRWLLFFTGQFTGSDGVLQVFNSQTVQGLLQLTFTPSHILGVPSALVVLLLFRHFSTRPSYRMGAILGLILGAVTLVAEWYFLPLAAGIAMVMAHRVWRTRSGAGRWHASRTAVAMLPVLVAVCWGSFNNTYLSGLLGHFWMRPVGVEESASVRQITTELTDQRALSASSLDEILDNRPVYKPVWAAPNMVPLRLNLDHFGQVPSWEAAASTEGSFIPILGTQFLMEASPVLLVGIPFGLWLAWRQRTPAVFLLAWLAAFSALPPVLLDWGYRSTDFLRFFTASYSYAALFLGWIAGDLICRPAMRSRLFGGALAASALVNPFGLGLVGLMPGTINRVKTIANSAQSLSQASTVAASSAAAEMRSKAFEKLAVTVGDFLFPLTKGRDRVIVVVPPDLVPPLKFFPEWMKMATLSRILIPVGWHWQDSSYSFYYRSAVTKLDPRAITSLDAKWVIISNLFQSELPAEVSLALADGARFAPAARFREGPYSMTIYKVRR